MPKGDSPTTTSRAARKGTKGAAPSFGTTGGPRARDTRSLQSLMIAQKKEDEKKKKKKRKKRKKK